MDDELSDQYRGRETMDKVRSIAADIFARYSVDFKTARRAGGWTNATWLAGGLALRISVRQGVKSIRCEARLAELLPQAVGYPTRLEDGAIDGFEWALSKEVPGECLGDVWSDLDWDAKITALRQLWEKAQAVHSVDASAAAGLARTRAWFNSCDTQEAEQGIARVMQQGLIASPQAEVLRQALARFWQALPTVGCVLNHGDLTLDNALWHAGQVVSLLDFEYAVMAPPELDLNVLVKHAFGPENNHTELPEADAVGQAHLRQGVIELAKPLINRPGGKDLLFGYAILLELWLLELWLAHPEGEGPLEQWEPYRRLLSLADGRGGYLAPLFHE